jgi:multiple sugar transport system permease protein
LTGLLFVLPSLVGLAAFFVVPFFQSVYYTFTQGIADISFVGLDNFALLFESEPFVLAVRNTAFFMGVGVPLLFALALVTSLFLSRAAYLLSRFALLAPLVVPAAAVVTAWRMLIGFVPVEAGDMFSVVLLFIWKNLGYIIVILTSAITVLPKEYTEVFRLESDSFIKLSALIIIPLIAPMAFFAALIAVMNSFKIFREIYMLYGSDPPRSIYMLQHFMNNNFFKLNYQRLSAAAFLVVGVVIVLIFVYMRLRDRFAEDL